MKALLIIVLLFSPLLAVAQQEALAIDKLEPEVRIVDPGGSMIEEYRSSGRVFMIKVTPKKGRPYFLVDADGDGNLDTHHNENAPRLLIPSWVIVSW